MFKLLILFILLSISFYTISGTAPIGRWQPGCNIYDPFVDIKSTGDVKIEVINNALYISAKIAKKIQGDMYEIYLLDVIENTVDINRANILKNKPIASFYIKGNKMAMKWLGFYDESKNKYIWGEQSDFSELSDKNNVTHLVRCSS